jgi:hypothetical protein
MADSRDVLIKTAILTQLLKKSLFYEDPRFKIIFTTATRPGPYYPLDTIGTVPRDKNNDKIGKFNTK